MHVIIFTVLGIIIFVASLLFFGERAAAPEVPQEGEPVFCTADAMQCPDGSWVGRSGPNCEFVCP